MKPLQINSLEFKRIKKKVLLENLSLTPSLQQKVLDIVNSDVKITPSIIKEALKHRKIQQTK